MHKYIVVLHHLTKDLKPETSEFCYVDSYQDAVSLGSKFCSFCGFRSYSIYELV